MVLFSHNNLQVSAEQIQGNVYIKEVWTGVFTSLLFRSLIGKSLDIYKEKVSILKQSNKHFLLFADVSKLELISEKDITWLTDEVNPQYEHLGFTHQAVVVPKAELGKKRVDNYEGVTDTGKFITELFATENAAVSWFFKRTNRPL